MLRLLSATGSFQQVARYKVAAGITLLIFSAYSLALLLTGMFAFWQALAAAIVNTATLMIVGAGARHLLLRFVLRQPPKRRMAGHLLLALAFSSFGTGS